MKKKLYEPFPTFVLRTPLYPLNVIGAWREKIQSPEFQEAIFLATPDLFNNSELSPDNDKSEKRENSLLKYYLRSCTRCTPFGLFAGCSTGKIGEETKIEFEPIEKYRRCTRLDMQYICALIQMIEKDPEVRDQLLYYPNDSLYGIGGKLRYIEYTYVKTRRKHHVASVEMDDYLTSVLELARSGKTIAELANSLVEDEITFEDAKEFIDELIDSQVLKSELDPSVVGDDVLTMLIRKLSRLKDVPVLEKIQQLQVLLQKIDSQPLGTTLPLYDEIIEIIKTIGIGFEAKYLFQTDMFKPSKTATVSREVIEDISEAIDFLNQIAQANNPAALDTFREAFLKLYEDREVPLTQVMDNELGLGYPKTSGGSNDLNVLVDDLPLPMRMDVNSRGSFGRVDMMLLKKYIETTKTDQTEIDISDAIENNNAPANQNQSPNPNAEPIPQTISVMCNLVSDSADERRIYIKSVGGSCGANLLGRFCHIDSSIQELVEQVAAREKEANPDVIFAEISHLPESRIGNIASRPLFRDYVLHYLSNTEAEEERCIDVTDLWVSIRRNRMVLRSRKLNKEVIPRLTCAHNFSMSPIPIYRFLCDIQAQHIKRGFGLGWGELFGIFDYLPRVRFKNVILCRQRWTIKKEDFKDCAKMKDDELAKFFKEFRENRKLVRHILIPESDNEMYIDLEDVSMIRMMLSLLKKRNTVNVEEFLFDEDKAVVRGDGGGFTNEMIFVLHKSLSKMIQRDLIPGSKWLYFKIYTGTKSGDDILTHSIYPFVQELLAQGHIKAYFFIRYTDPEFHIRLRLMIENPLSYGVVFKSFYETFQPCFANHMISDIVCDTYRREIERYGDQTMEVTEELFYYDADAIIRVLRTFDGLDVTTKEHERWKASLLFIDDTFNALGWSMEQKEEFIAGMARNYKTEFGFAEGGSTAPLNDKYRNYRKDVDQAMTRESDAYKQYESVLEERKSKMATILSNVDNLLATNSFEMRKEGYISSLIHMTMNRLFKSKNRVHELIIYEFMHRYYKSANAQLKYRKDK